MTLEKRRFYRRGAKGGNFANDRIKRKEKKKCVRKKRTPKRKKTNHAKSKKATNREVNGGWGGKPRGGSIKRYSQCRQRWPRGKKKEKDASKRKQNETNKKKNGS